MAWAAGFKNTIKGCLISLDIHNYNKSYPVGIWASLIFVQLLSGCPLQKKENTINYITNSYQLFGGYRNKIFNNMIDSKGIIESSCSGNETR